MSVRQEIESRLTQHLKPSHLEVINESHQHNVPANSETHFKVIIVSDHFQQHQLVKRHQTVYRLLNDLMQNPIHALSIHSYTNSEWLSQPKVQDSPQCLGGAAREKRKNPEQN